MPTVMAYNVAVCHLSLSAKWHELFGGTGEQIAIKTILVYCKGIGSTAIANVICLSSI